MLNATDSSIQERYANRLVFLSNEFLENLDDSQVRLMHLANVAYAGYAELLDLMKPVDALVSLIKFEAPILFSISSDEQSLQEIVSELIEHDIEQSSQSVQNNGSGKPTSAFGLQASQVRIFNYLREQNLPIRFLLLTLSSKQRASLLREIFTGVYQDDQHPNPHEGFIILKLYVSYFTMSQSGIDLVDQAQAVQGRFIGYQTWFIRRLEQLRGRELHSFQDQLSDIDKSHLTFEQVLAFRVAQGESFDPKEFKQFLATLDELSTFQFFVQIVLQEQSDQAITPQMLLKQIREDQKYVFKIELTNSYLQEQI